MKFSFKRDLHIHSYLSLCSGDLEQTNEKILQYAEENELEEVCVTNHFWDENVPGASDWYSSQNYEHVSKAKPLPQTDKVRFLFGCETDINRHMTLGISKERIELFDFIIIPTTHFHMKGFTLSQDEASDCLSRANAWVKRLDAVLNMELPFHKIGLAHLTCNAIAPVREEYLRVLELLPEEEMKRLFKRVAQLGAGIELNYGDMSFADEEEDIVLRPYRIAKECGCKFYCGSDAHHPKTFDKAKETFERAIDKLGLTDEDEFVLHK